MPESGWVRWDDWCSVFKLVCQSYCGCLNLTSVTTRCFSYFFFHDTATTEIYTLSLHDALPIFGYPKWHEIGGSFCPLLPSRPPWRFQDSSEIGRAHVCTPVTQWSRMPSSAWKKKENNTYKYLHNDVVLRLLLAIPKRNVAKPLDVE